MRLGHNRERPSMAGKGRPTGVEIRCNGKDPHFLYQSFVTGIVVDKVEERFILQEYHTWRAVAERVFQGFQRVFLVVEKRILKGEVDWGSVHLAGTGLQKLKPL